MDPRLAEKLLRSPGSVQYFTPAMLSGLQRRVLTRDWSTPERVVYAAIEDGYTNREDLSAATGLDLEQVNEALDSLSGKGFIKIQVVE